MRRVISATGRFGFVLIAIALALFVTSSLPTRNVSDSGYRWTQSGVFTTIVTNEFPNSFSLSPQQVLHLTFTVLNVTSALDFFLIRTDPTFFNNWIFTQNKDPNATSPNNLKTLNAFIQTYPQTVVASLIGVRGLDYTFSPTNITTVLPVASNPTGSTVLFQFTASVIDGFIPVEKANVTIEVLSGLGFGFTALWSAAFWKESTRLD